MANRLVFLYGAMDSGKSLSLITRAYQAEKADKVIKVLTSQDRSGKPKVTSRLGVSRICDEYNETTKLWDIVNEEDIWIDELYIDEAQFLTAEQVDVLAEIASQDRDIYCYGLLTDFKSELFPGSRRLVELADELVPLQNFSLCWCGSEGRFNTRTVHGEAVYEGPQVMIGDLDEEVGYVVLCRRHYFDGMIS